MRIILMDTVQSYIRPQVDYATTKYALGVNVTEVHARYLYSILSVSDNSMFNSQDAFGYLNLYSPNVLK
jgi:hypothetical protein